MGAGQTPDIIMPTAGAEKRYLGREFTANFAVSKNIEAFELT
jgi:hypothetical protein